MNSDRWTGFPEPTEKQIERSVVSAITWILEQKKRYDRCGAKWFVGTSPHHGTGRLSELLAHGSNLVVARSEWEVSTAAKAAREISQYHGMELVGSAQTTDMCVYAYTDREPTMNERRKRSKDPLTVKQKRVFNSIKEHVLTHGDAPTQSQLMRVMGHRSGSTTRKFLEILERKNWIIAPSQGKRLEMV